MDRQASKRAFLTFIVNAAQSEPLIQGADLFFKEHGRWIDLDIFYVNEITEDEVPAARVAKSLRECDAAFLDIRGGGLAANIAVSALTDRTQPVLLLAGGSPELMRIARLGSLNFKSMAQRMESARDKNTAFNIRKVQKIMKNVERAGRMLPVGSLKHMKNWIQITNYWVQSGPENIKNMLAFVGREYLDLKLPKPKPPIQYPPFGLYDLFTEKFYSELGQYLADVPLDPAKATVALIFYGGIHFAQSIIPAKTAARELREKHGLNIIPLFSDAGYNLEAMKKFLFQEGRPLIDAAIYFQWFQLTTFAEDEYEQAKELLKKLDVPIFNAAPMYGREVEKWLAADEGLSPVETMTTVIIPEIDGMIEPLPSAGVVEQSSPLGEGSMKVVAPIPDRIERICGRVAKLVRLRRMKNQDKRVALIIYNNPPGEESLGNAAYLDGFESLRRIMAEMKEQGYTITRVPEQGELPEMFVKNGLVNIPRWGGQERGAGHGRAVRIEEYSKWLQEIPGTEEIIEAWGEAPGGLMTHRGAILLPALEFGNILVALQPSRGFSADPDKISHDKTLPPHHQYVAFYRWLEREWKPDVMVHVGTHGTLEFLKGKELGLSRYCWPDILMGDIPHLYLYHVVNASEAVIAKRRGLATLISYNSPSFISGGLYDEYAGLEDLIAEYMEAKSLDPTRAERLWKTILEKAAEVGIGKASIEEIHEELTLMKRSLIPKGLHCFGDGIDEGGRLEFASHLARYDFDGAPSLHRLLAEARGWDYHDLLKNPSRIGEGKIKTAMEEVEAEAKKLIENVLVRSAYPADSRLAKVLHFLAGAAARLGGDLEMKNLMRGLNGRFIEPGLGGDPLRHPDILPTGRNIYQFDPRLVPSQEAMKRGAEIAESTLAHYHAERGEYPKSTGVILWGFETTKTRGETVGQVLAYLGVRISKKGSPYYKELEVIPLEELGRPRVDCLVQICGFFRDMYANVINLIHRAFELVSELDEPEEMNFIRLQTRELESRLRDEVPEGRLRAVAAGRIYGPRPGEYGTRTTYLIESAAWENEEEIAEVFAASMSHLYAPNLHGERNQEAYQTRLGKVELVSQIRDSHEYEIADLDHYYEFFGGLSRTVESARGKRPVMLITDTTREVIRTEKIEDAIQRGVRARLLNPRWIESMLEHHYHGAQHIGDRVENLVGLAATTHAVDSRTWSEVNRRYVMDHDLFRRMVENNRFAMQEIIKRLMEAERRGYWEATEEELEVLRNRFLELEALLEEEMHARSSLKVGE